MELHRRLDHQPAPARQFDHQPSRTHRGLLGAATAFDQGSKQAHGASTSHRPVPTRG